MEKLSHEHLVLRHLFGSRSLTRSEIAEHLGIRKNTIGACCGALLAHGKIVEEDPGRKRNSRVLLNPEAFLAVGIEHRVDGLRIVIVDGGFQVLHRREVPLAEEDQAIRVRSIIESVRDILSNTSVHPRRITGIGFGDFVPHNIGAGLRMKSVWMPEWGDIDIQAVLERDLGFKVSVMRFPDAFAVAEHRIGSCQDDEPFCVVQLDKGIGLSVFRNGTFQRGSTDIFGEIGHTVCGDAGEICKCGNRGCLEMLAGTGAIVQKIRENMGKGFLLSTLDASADVTFEDVVMNAVEGNKLALLVLNEATRAIGDSIANMVNILGIMRIVLFGDLVKAGDILLQQVNASLRSHCIYPLNQNTRVWISGLDSFASAAGAGYVALSRFFERVDGSGKARRA